MTPLTATPSVEALAWALVHFLWQGTAIALIFVLWLRGRPTPQARYVAGIVALAALLLAPVATFALRTSTAASVERSRTAVLPLLPAAGAGVPAPTTTPVASLTAADLRHDDSAAPAASDRAAVVIVAAWAAGVLLLAFRLAGGWILARRLTARGTAPAGDRVAQATAAISRRLGVRRAVWIVESTVVTVPVLVGWLKPVVLMPVAALSGLSPAQIDTLIAHELAHVRRHDYLVNMLQSLLETLLFYHPAVWMVSREVRDAREQCCDDLVIAVCDPVVYASALFDLAEMNRAPRMALAATGGSLLGRVQRLLGQPHERSGPGVASVGVLALALVLGGALPFAIGSAASTDARGSDARRDVRLHAADEGAVPREGDAPDRPLLERIQAMPPQPDPPVAAPVDTAVPANVQGTVLNCLVHPDGTVSDCAHVQRTVLNCVVHPDGAVSGCEVVRSLDSTAGVDESVAGSAALADARPPSTSPALGSRSVELSVAHPWIAAEVESSIVIPPDVLATAPRPSRDVAPVAMHQIPANQRIPPQVRDARTRDGHELPRPIRVSLSAAVRDWTTHRLLTVAEAGSAPGVAEMVAAGADVNARSTRGSPLIAAARSGSLAAVDLLLVAGANPNLVVRGHGSPLSVAANQGHVRIVERLLEEGATPDAAVSGHGTALIAASANGHLAVVQVLVSHGADVNRRSSVDAARGRSDGEWRTALSVARRDGHDAVVGYLLSHGAQD